MDRIVVADDHPLFRAALRSAVEKAAPGAVIAECASLAEVLAALGEGATDLLLLDLKLSDSEGMGGLTRIRADHPAVPVAVVSASEEPPTVRRALTLGAAGFIPKSAPAETMGEAIASVLDGGSWFPPMAAERSEADAELAARLAQLTPQQFRVLLCLADGLLNKQIAAELGLAENTVKVHVTAILKKLACYSRTQAAVLVKSLEAEDGGVG